MENNQVHITFRLNSAGNSRFIIHRCQKLWLWKELAISLPFQIEKLQSGKQNLFSKQPVCRMNNSRCRSYFWPEGQINTAYIRLESFKYTYITVIALNAVTAPLSFLGNGLFLLVLCKTPSLIRPSNILIGSLSFADLLIGVLVQPLMCAFVHEPALYESCAFIDTFTFVAHMIACVSGSTMAAISIERYLALFMHLRYNQLVTKERIQRTIFVIWIFWFLIDMLAFFGYVTRYVNDFRGIVAIVVWTAGCSLIVGIYIKVYFLVQRHRHEIIELQSTSGGSNLDESTSASQINLAVTMGYVIGVSLACYIPACVVYTLLAANIDGGPALFSVFFVTMSLQFVSSSFNPVLYCWKVEDVRQAMVNLWNTWRGATWRRTSSPVGT